MSRLKSTVIKWAIKQIVKDANGTYGDMRYLEDVLENEWGEKMFIFSHQLVPLDKEKLAKANARATEAADLSSEHHTSQQASPHPHPQSIEGNT